MRISVSLRLASTLVTAFALTISNFVGVTTEVALATSLATCTDAPSRALADIGNALTSGSDATVLQAALANRSRLLSCGLTRQAISTELIAADAYGDVNEPKQRCDALRSAHNESLRIGDASRAQMIDRTLRGC